MKSGDYDDIHRRMEGAINAFKHDIASLRTGRASSNLLDAVQVKAYGENARVAVRHVRRDGMDFLKKAEKDGDISEDDHRRQSEQVQKLTDDTISTVDSLLAGKEAEIMQV